MESGGEYSYENLAFKHLRNSGYLQKLADFKNYLITKTYTLLEKDDRCTRIAKQKYEEWPSAYASGAVVRCRQGKIWKDLKEDSSQDDEYRLEEINKFTNFCSEKLNVEPPNIKLHTTSEYTDNNRSFGGYDITDNSITVSVHNRNLADILRTVAHELVHHKQNSKGILNIDSGDDGSPHENQANKIAGIMLRIYSKDNPHIYE